MDLREIDEFMDWIQVPHIGIQWYTSVVLVLNLQGQLEILCMVSDMFPFMLSCSYAASLRFSKTKF